MKNFVRKIIRPFYHELYKYNRLRVKRYSPYINIYYCCTQRTGSQWFREVFRDPLFYKYTGLRPYPYVQKGLNEANFSQPLPRRTTGIHLYIGYSAYQSIPKPEKYKTFFILRDPRDIVVSWYFSTKYSHASMLYIPKLRQEIELMNLQHGMKFCIDTLEDFGLFAAQKSWMEIDVDGDDNMIFRYEDFAINNLGFLKELLAYLEVQIPQSEFDDLYLRHTFEKVTGGRKQGVEEKNSHYRKGVSGDWREYFDPSIMDYFRGVTGDLLEVLGYSE